MAESPVSVSVVNLAGIIELALAAVGLVLLWRTVLSPSARARRAPSPLSDWSAPITEFLIFIGFVLTGSIILALVAGVVVKQLPLRGDVVTVLNGAAAQLGMLGGVVLFRSSVERTSPLTILPGPRIVASGVATFLISLPLMMIVAKTWEFGLEHFGLPTDRQDLVGMFAHADTPWLLTVMIALAVIIAPLTEELVFRAGLFRYARTRLPRGLALLLPALFFASLHVNWDTLQGLSSLAPLVVLAIVFSLAYERTGHIGTPIVAHALFNLNTVLLILSGVVI